VTLPVLLVPSAADSIRAAIAAGQGSIPFSQFMELALYGEHGFYATTGRAGRRGDFITSPEVGPLFGTVLARAIDAVWKRLGSPDNFHIIEVGAGPGTLARSVLAAQPQCLAHGTYIAVETSAHQRELHPEGVLSQASMPTTAEYGVVIANELLDNMPCELWVYDDGWREAHVTAHADSFAEVLVGNDAPQILPSRAPHGSRAPIQTAAAQWLSSSITMLEHGAIFVFDYCTPLTAEVALMPWREWLRTYVGHEKGVHYLRNSGSQDITTQVLIDQLAQVREPDAVRSQAQFLQLWGIDELVEEGKRVWSENASAPNLAAIKMRSRVSEAEALCDVGGLGGFTVLEWTNE
jgi:SAM-dependent MidA family methyltransferase